MSEDDSTPASGKGTAKRSVFDLACRLRGEADVIAGTVPRMMDSARLITTTPNGPVAVTVSVQEDGTSWVPMFAPDWLDHGAGVETRERKLAYVPAKPWNPNAAAGVTTYKQIFRYPDFLPDHLITPRDITRYKLERTSIWTKFPDIKTAKAGDDVAMTYRPRDADTIAGMTRNNMHQAVMRSQITETDLTWDPTCWLANIYQYYCSYHAATKITDADLLPWDTGNQLNTIATLSSPLLDHVNNDPDALLGNCRPGTAAVGYVPKLTPGASWQAGVAEAVSGKIDRLFHSTEITAASGVTYPVFCYDGKLSRDATLVFTTDMSVVAKQNLEYAEFPLITCPPEVLKDTDVVADRNRRVALWVLSLMPCMATCIAAVQSATPAATTGVGAATIQEGLAYWLGGACRYLMPENVIINIPIDNWSDLNSPSLRVLVPPTFGPRAVRCCRDFGLGVARRNAGDLIAAGAPIFQGQAAVAEISMSAYIASWLGSGGLTIEEWSWFTKWVRRTYHAEGALAKAIAMYEYDTCLRRAGVITDTHESAAVCNSYGIAAGNWVSRDGTAQPFQTPVYDSMTRCDGVLAHCGGRRDRWLPRFYRQLAGPLASHMYEITNKDSVPVICDAYFKKDVDPMSLALCSTRVKSIIYDAVRTAIGPEAMILLSSTSYFRRMGVGANADSIQTRRTQDTLKALGNTMWSRLVEGEVVFGWYYKLFAELSERYVSYTGALMPEEAYYSEPPENVTANIVDAAGDVVCFDWYATGGPRCTAANAGVWSTGALAYPGISFVFNMPRTVGAAGQGYVTRPDYSLLVAYQYLGRAVSNEAAVLGSAALSNKGLWSWYIHQRYGLELSEVSKWKYERFGDKVPLQLEDEVTPEVYSNMPIRITSSRPGKTALRVGVGQLVDTTTAPFVSERDHAIMRQLAAWSGGNVELRRLHFTTVAHSFTTVYEERPPLNSCNFVGMNILRSLPPTVAATNGYALSMLFANRVPAYTEDLCWLYYYTTEANYMLLSDNIHVMNNRSITDVQFICSVERPLMRTVRGRSIMLLDPTTLGKVPTKLGVASVAELPSKPETRTQQREAKDDPIHVDDTGPESFKKNENLEATDAGA